MQNADNILSIYRERRKRSLESRMSRKLSRPVRRGADAKEPAMAPRRRPTLRRVVVLVDPRYTSKTCSQCGHRFESLSLSQRWVDCECGLSLDRDHNAAINILKRAGQVRWASSSAIAGFAGVPSGPSRATLVAAECHKQTVGLRECSNRI